MRSADARIQPRRSPPQTGFDSEPRRHNRRVEDGGGPPWAGKPELVERLVDDDRRAGVPGDAQHFAALSLADQHAGRVVEVRNEEGQAR